MKPPVLNPGRGIGMTSARTRERLVQRLRDQGITNEKVLDQIRNVPRHLFVDEALATRAYEDTALPIGQGQTISQPYVVARMTEALLEGREPRKILEIGTGCGYQTAVIAPLVKFVPGSRNCTFATCISAMATASKVGHRTHRTTPF
jgi:protein-L-isoaspartate(D-aspartate) O-methyltransferase